MPVTVCRSLDSSHLGAIASQRQDFGRLLQIVSIGGRAGALPNHHSQSRHRRRTEGGNPSISHGRESTDPNSEWGDGFDNLRVVSASGCESLYEVVALARIFHQDPEFSRRGLFGTSLRLTPSGLARKSAPGRFLGSDCSNHQKSMLFIGLQVIRASWAQRSREKPESLGRYKLYPSHCLVNILIEKKKHRYLERPGEISGLGIRQSRSGTPFAQPAEIHHGG